MQIEKLILYLPIFLGLNMPLVMAESHSLIVEPDWLVSNISDNDLVIVDVRSNDKYLKSHITNAVNLPVSKAYATGSRSDLVAPISVIKNLLGKQGISNSSYVVLYDDGGFIDAGRVFWVLEVFGHTRVSVLNLGYGMWQASGRPISKEVNVPIPVEYIPAIQPGRLATTLQVRLAIDNPNHILIDVRPVEEYRGQASKTDVFGHIPGAINIPATLNLDENKQKIRPMSELEKLYNQFDKDQPITVYCNKGKQSALVYYVLRNLGHQVSAYDGSWYEWSQHPEFPIVNLNSTSED